MIIKTVITAKISIILSSSVGECLVDCGSIFGQLAKVNFCQVNFLLISIKEPVGMDKIANFVKQILLADTVT